MRYLAGYLDAEGSFAVRGGSIAVRVSNTHRSTLLDLQAAHGGSVLRHGTGSGKGRSRRRRSWQWALHGAEAEAVLRKVLPHLQEKRLQALLLLEFRRARPADPLRPWIRGALNDLKRLEHDP